MIGQIVQAANIYDDLGTGIDMATSDQYGFGGTNFGISDDWGVMFEDLFSGQKKSGWDYTKDIMSILDPGTGGAMYRKSEIDADLKKKLWTVKNNLRSVSNAPQSIIGRTAGALGDVKKISSSILDTKTQKRLKDRQTDTGIAKSILSIGSTAANILDKGPTEKKEKPIPESDKSAGSSLRSFNVTPGGNRQPYDIVSNEFEGFQNMMASGGKNVSGAVPVEAEGGEILIEFDPDSYSILKKEPITGPSHEAGGVHGKLKKNQAVLNREQQARLDGGESLQSILASIENVGGQAQEGTLGEDEGKKKSRSILSPGSDYPSVGETKEPERDIYGHPSDLTKNILNKIISNPAYNPSIPAGSTLNPIKDNSSLDPKIILGNATAHFLRPEPAVSTFIQPHPVYTFPASKPSDPVDVRQIDQEMPSAEIEKEEQSSEVTPYKSPMLSSPSWFETMGIDPNSLTPESKNIPNDSFQKNYGVNWENMTGITKTKTKNIKKTGNWFSNLSPADWTLMANEVGNLASLLQRKPDRIQVPDTRVGEPLQFSPRRINAKPYVDNINRTFQSMMSYYRNTGQTDKIPSLVSKMMDTHQQIAEGIAGKNVEMESSAMAAGTQASTQKIVEQGRIDAQTIAEQVGVDVEWLKIVGAQDTQRMMSIANMLQSMGGYKQAKRDEAIQDVVMGRLLADQYFH